MAKFRKKPVILEAVQLTPEYAPACLVGEAQPPFGLFVSGDFPPGQRTLQRAWISIRTLEGTMRADLNDWIIQGVKGELYPCKPDIFADLYEEVHDAQT